jgi:hypothetical protein
MPVTAAIRRRQARNRKGIGLPGDNSKILNVARAIREFVDAPVLGGIAVYLHGYERTTTDLDLYTPNRALTDQQLQAAGARWDTARREHLLNDVRIHTVTPEDARHVVEKTSIIEGIRVVSLKDLIAIKLICGLKNPHRAKDIADVMELVREIPLDKRFAAKLPKELRAEFKSFVDVVRGGKRSGDGRRF